MPVEKEFVIVLVPIEALQLFFEELIRKQYNNNAWVQAKAVFINTHYS